MESEIWVPIKGFEGYYEISNKKRVRSIQRAVKRVGQNKARIKGRTLKLSHDGKASLSKEGAIYRKSVNVMYNEYFGTPQTFENICGREDIVNSFKGLCNRLGIQNPEAAIDTREGYIPNIIKVISNYYNGKIHDNEIAKALRRERSSISNAKTVYKRDFGFDVNLMRVQSEFDKYLNLDVPAKNPIVQNIINEIWEDIERYSWNAIKRQKEFYIKKFEKQL